MEKQNDSPQMILRIKRKRNEEPLDALLVQHQDLQDFGKDKRSKKDSMKASNSTLKVSAMALPRIFRLAETVEEDSFKNISEAKKLKDRISRRIRPGTRSDTSGNFDTKRDKKTQHSQTSAKQARYRLITQNRTKIDKTMPPTVQSSSEKAAEDLFQLYEAVKEEKHKEEPKLFMDDDEENPDDIMCNFIPMVKEYLTLHDKVEEPVVDDYVYDVYYCDKSTDDDVITGPNVGSLMWFDQETEYLNEDSDSEIGDNEDEDSNAEDFYQNDYPDEEDSDEDYEDQYGYEESSDVDYY